MKWKNILNDTPAFHFMRGGAPSSIAPSILPTPVRSVMFLSSDTKTNQPKPKPNPKPNPAIHPPALHGPKQTQHGGRRPRFFARFARSGRDCRAVRRGPECIHELKNDFEQSHSDELQGECRESQVGRQVGRYGALACRKRGGPISAFEYEGHRASGGVVAWIGTRSLSSRL